MATNSLPASLMSIPPTVGICVHIMMTSRIAALTGFHGRIVWDASQPNGQPRRCLDIARAEREFGWRARTSFDEGLRNTVEYYVSSRRSLALV